MTPSWMSKIPATNRNRRRPIPGQPFGNIENNRCTRTSTSSLGVEQQPANPQEQWPEYTSFEGLEVDDAALQSNRDSMSAVIGAKFRENVLDVAFDGLLRNGQLIGDHFVRVSRSNQSQDLDFADG